MAGSLRRRLRHSGVALAVLAALFGVTSLAACGGTTSDGATSSGTPAPALTGPAFTIAVAGPMTGQWASYGTAQKAAAEIAVAQLNAAGGVNGGPVKMIVADDRGSREESVVIAQQFIDNEAVAVVNGHSFSGCVLAAGPIYQLAGLPMISPSATIPQISRLGSYIWRVCPSDPAQAAGLARYSVEVLGAKRIAVLNDGADQYGRGLSRDYIAGVKKAGGTIIIREQYMTGDTDFRAQLSAIATIQPDLLFLAGYYPEGAQIATQAKELGLSVQMLGTDGYSARGLLTQGGEAVEGMLVSTFFDASRDDPAVQTFVQAYRDKNNGADPDWFAATSFDAMMLAARAATDAGSTERSAINEALGAIRTFRGVSGPMRFDKNGDVIKPLSIVVVKDGAFVTAPQQPREP